MPITYEWDIETIEYGDIIDHHHGYTLNDFYTIQLTNIDNKSYRLALVRDDNMGRWWSYVYFNSDKGWVLPECFFDAFDRPGPVVPKRFQKELDSSKNKWRKVA